jgi:hypothetical protein
MFYAIHVVFYQIFVQVMVFCNIDYAHLIEIKVKVKPAHILISYVVSSRWYEKTHVSNNSKKNEKFIRINLQLTWNDIV